MFDDEDEAWAKSEITDHDIRAAARFASCEYSGILTCTISGHHPNACAKCPDYTLAGKEANK